MMGKTFIHFVKVCLKLEMPQTQTTQAERDMLAGHVGGKRNLVEVGVFEGFTSRLLAESADANATLYGVDPFFPGRAGISWGLLVVKCHCRELLRKGKLRLVQSFSTEVGDRVPLTVDFVFIDADHSLPGITADWAFWSERCREGGIIALHDTVLRPDQPSSAELGSHQYFRQYIQHDSRFNMVGQVDSLTVLEKQ